MNRDQIEAAKRGMLGAVNDRPSDTSFAALSMRAERNLEISIEDARVVVDAAMRASGGFAKLTNPGGEEVPALADAVFLMQGLRYAKNMVFAGAESIDIGIGGQRVNKVSKRLYCATEGYEAAQSAVSALSGVLEEGYPGFREDTYELAARALISTTEWDQAALDQLEAAPYARNMLLSLENDGAVSFTLFVCPPVEFGYLSGDQPEEYLRTSMRESLLSRQAEDLQRLFGNLERAKVPVRLTVVIGDADENDYIWPAIGRPANLSEDKLAPRREELRKSVVEYLSQSIKSPQGSVPRIITAEQVEVISLAATRMPPAAERIYSEFVSNPEKLARQLRQLDYQDERARMLELWTPGDYYDGLPQPDERQLERVVLMKFAAYAMQGVYLSERVPNSVLIQTERPPLLRTRMMNTGRRSLEIPEIPAIYQNLSSADYELEAYGGLIHG